jgi:hypothetical protein
VNVSGNCGNCECSDDKTDCRECLMDKFKEVLNDK